MKFKVGDRVTSQPHGKIGTVMSSDDTELPYGVEHDGDPTGYWWYRDTDLTPIQDIDHADFAKIAAEIAEIVKTKNAAYGDSFANASKYLEILYPKGVTVQEYSRLLFLVRVLDKIGRIAQDPHSLNEDAYADICGYALLAISNNRRAK